MLNVYSPNVKYLQTFFLKDNPPKEEHSEIPSGQIYLGAT